MAKELEITTNTYIFAGVGALVLGGIGNCFFFAALVVTVTYCWHVSGHGLAAQRVSGGRLDLLADE